MGKKEEESSGVEVHELNLNDKTEIGRGMDLTGRCALITGGGSGIGRGCAEMLAQAGADVVIVGRREAKFRQVQEGILAAGGSCEIYPADLTADENCERMAAFCLEKFGRIDILVNSAGSTGKRGTLEEEMAADNFGKTMAVDFNAVFAACRSVIPAMKAQKSGSIINIASLAALQARGPIVYSAAKGAVRSFSRSLAGQLGADNVRVNSVYPGFIVTEMTEKIEQYPEQAAALRAESVLNAFGHVEDIAYCVWYLASDAAKFVTGQEFVIDGGTTIK